MRINLLDKIKLCFNKKRQLYFDLYPILGFYPRNIAPYEQALVHSSLRQRNAKGNMINNELLEFLGDAIIEAVISDVVYHRFEGKREGFLTTTRSKLVQRETLNKVAMEIGLNELIHTTIRREEQHNSYLGGNAFEALVGAIYLDRGYKTCQWFLCNRILGRVINLDDMAQREMNFKSKLLEWSQKNHIETDFALTHVENEGTDSPVFQTTIKLENIEIGCGRGFSKKESQQEAAKNTVLRLKNEPQLAKTILKKKKIRLGELPAEEVSSDGSATAPKPERPVKKRTRKAAAKAREDGSEAAVPQATEKKQPAPAKQEKQSAKQEKQPVKTKKEEQPVKKAAPAKKTENPVAKKEREAEKTTTSNETGQVKPARRQRQRKKTDDTTVKQVAEPLEPTIEQKEKEAIIRAAEEAAFTQ